MTPSPQKRLLLGFVAGALAVLSFHQGVWWLLNQAGAIPLDRPAWPLDPIAPFGVASLISKMFWGGVWGAALTLLLARIKGAPYWIAWVVAGATALPFVAMFVVPVVKGQPMPELWPRALVSATVNAAWGLGTAFFLRLFGATRA